MQAAITIQSSDTIKRMRDAGALAAEVLDIACRSATVGTTTHDVDAVAFQAIVKANAYDPF